MRLYAYWSDMKLGRACVLLYNFPPNHFIAHEVPGKHDMIELLIIFPLKFADFADKRANAQSSVQARGQVFINAREKYPGPVKVANQKE